MIIKIDNHKFKAVFEETKSPQSCLAFKKLMPFAGKVVHVRWSGEGMWIPLGDMDFDLRHIPNVVDIRGKYSIRQAGLLMKYVKFHISMDSIMAHLSATTHTSGVVVWGATSPSYFVFILTYCLPSSQDGSAVGIEVLSILKHL